LRAHLSQLLSKVKAAPWPEENPGTYLPSMAMTLINLSIFYLQATPNQEKSIGMATEALEILQNFADVPYLK
jgi:hypothetical protein